VPTGGHYCSFSLLAQRKRTKRNGARKELALLKQLFGIMALRPEDKNVSFLSKVDFRDDNAVPTKLI